MTVQVTVPKMQQYSQGTTQEVAPFKSTLAKHNLELVRWTATTLQINLVRDLYMCGRKIHVSEMAGPPEPGIPIITADHCYTYTAGLGFT